jgi:hypothetical protein
MPDIEILLTMTASVRHKGGTSAKTRAVTKVTTLAGPFPAMAMKILAQEGVDELVPGVEDDLEQLKEES